MRSRGSALAGVLAIALLAAAPAGAAPDGPDEDVACEPHGPPRGGVVLLHSGGFVIGANADYLRSFCAPFTAAGLRAVAVDYPVRDYAGAVRAARQAARRLSETTSPVVAYGESAGGTLALRLGLGGRVAAVAAVAAPTNLVSWNRDAPRYWSRVMRMSLAERRRGSPLFRVAAHRPPTLLLHSPDDEIVPFRQSVALLQRLPSARLRRLTGPHAAHPSARPRALAWVLRQVRRLSG